MPRLVRSFVLVCCLAPLCLTASGCFLLRALLWPAETARAAIGSVSYNIAEGLTGGPNPTTTAAESLENIDRILAEHPDAANRDSLVRLRDELAKEAGSERGLQGRQARGDREPFAEGRPVMATSLTQPPVVDEHDRHQGNFPVHDRIGALQEPVYRRNVESSLRVQHPALALEDAMRTVTSRPTPVPHRSDLPPPVSEVPLIRIDRRGQVHHNVPMGGRIFGATYPDGVPEDGP